MDARFRAPLTVVGLGVVALVLSAPADASGDLAYGQVASWSTPGIGPVAIAADANGIVTAVGTTYPPGSRVERFTSQGQRVASWDGTGTPGGPLASPRDVAVDASGEVLISEPSRVRRFSADGVELASWAADDPSGVTVAPDGTVYVIVRNAIERRTSTGTLLSTIPLPFQVSTVGLAVAADQSVYFTAGSIFKMSASGKIEAMFGNEESRGREGGPYIGLAITQSGDIWTQGNFQLSRYSADRDLVETCAGGSDGTGASDGDLAVRGDTVFAASGGQILAYARGGSPTCNPPDLPARLGSARFSPATFRTGRTAGSATTRLRFRLSSPSQVNAAFFRYEVGVRKGSRCEPRRPTPGSTRCRVSVETGSWLIEGRAGQNSIPFSGWTKRRAPGSPVRAAKALPAGKYRVDIRAIQGIDSEVMQMGARIARQRDSGRG